MPNPSGVNNFDRFASEASYGAVNRMTDLERAAPVPGVHPLNAPRRARRHATRQDRPRAAAAADAPVNAAPSPTDAPSRGAVETEVWRELAQHPDASPLVKQYASELGG